MMRIAYVGPHRGTSLHRGRALERLGHAVTIVDPWSWLPKARWVAPWMYRTGAIGSNMLLARNVVEAVTMAMRATAGKCSKQDVKSLGVLGHHRRHGDALRQLLQLQERVDQAAQSKLYV